jgi:Cu-Zn family superoxide dismutase
MISGKRHFGLILLSGLCAIHLGLAQTPAPRAPAEMPMHESGAALTHAIAVLYPAGDSQVHGTILFEKVSGGVKVTADITGLSPGDHGFHIHEYGDCSSSDAASAGGHFNPAKMSHGGPHDPARHEGDMGNITAGADGKAHLEWTDPMMSLEGRNSILGRSVIVHAGTDDMKTQPTGNSGARVACGVIGVAK